MKRTFACAAAVLVSALVLAGCTPPQGNDAGPPSASSDVPSTITTQAATTGEPKPGNPGTGIIKAASMTSCDTVSGKVTAKGTVTPPEGVKGTVKITVSWVDPKTSSVLASGEQFFKDARPGKALDWAINAEITKQTSEIKCVLGASVL